MIESIDRNVHHKINSLSETNFFVLKNSIADEGKVGFVVSKNFCSFLRTTVILEIALDNSRRSMTFSKAPDSSLSS